MKISLNKGSKVDVHYLHGEGHSGSSFEERQTGRLILMVSYHVSKTFRHIFICVKSDYNLIHSIYYGPVYRTMAVKTFEGFLFPNLFLNIFAAVSALL